MRKEENEMNFLLAMVVLKQLYIAECIWGKSSYPPYIRYALLQSKISFYF